jgi:hypothetical protein
MEHIGTDSLTSLNARSDSGARDTLAGNGTCTNPLARDWYLGLKSLIIRDLRHS